MAKRDVELIIKAKDEASRALNSVASELSNLDIEQKGTAASGRTMAGTLAETVRGMVQFERVSGLVVAASNRAEAAIDGQRAAIKRTAADLTAVQAQLNAARSAIDKAGSKVVDARLAGGDAAAEVVAYKAAQQAVRDLDQQQAKLTRTLSTQESVLVEQERNFREIASQANTAEAALASFGDESSRASLKVAASAEEAAAMLRQQSAAQDEANRAAKARSFFDSDPATAGIDARSTALADMLRQEDAQADSLARLQSRLDPLASIERKLAQETQFLAKAQRDGLLTIAQYDKALEQLQLEANASRDALTRVGRGEKGKVALFGLKPYELTNLGYQVNDLVTQVASGTSVMQAFAQQGGQILQLLPQIGSRIIGAFRSPPLLIFAVAVGAVAVVLKEASDAAERLRRVEGIVSAIGDGAGATAAQLAKVAGELDNMGLSADESVQMVRRFVSGGLNTDLLEEFTTAAQNFAQVSGKEIPEAAAEMQAAFTRGFDGVAELDDAWQFLTASEREHIRAMFESGNAADARTEAFRIFGREMEEIAAKERGSWAGATRSLGRAFDELLQTLGNSDAAQGFIHLLDQAVEQMDISLKKTEELTTAQAELELATLKRFRAENPVKPGETHVSFLGSNNGKTIDQEIAALEQLIAKRKEAGSDNGDLNDAESVAARKRTADTLAEIRRERELANARSGADRVRIAGENAYRAEIEKTGNVQIANARKLAAVEEARRAEAKRAETERKQLDTEFAARIADNGRDQLVSTAQRFAGQSETRDRGSLTDFFRQNGINVDPKMTAWCAAFVNAVLATNGLPTVNQATGGSNLRAQDFLAYGQEVSKPEPGDIVIIKRGSGGQGHVGLFQGFTGKGDVRVLGGNQGDGVNTSTFKASSVLGFRRAPSVGDVAQDQAKAEAKRLKTQEEFNQKIDDENVDRMLGVELTKRQQALSGEALLDEQRNQAINAALLKARTDALENELELTQDREQAIRASVGAEFDLAHARDRANAALNDATTERNALLQRLQQAEREGDPVGIANAEAAVQRLDDAMRKAIDHAIELMKTLADTPENRAAITNLETARGGIGLDARDRQSTRVQKPVNDLQAQRNALLEQITAFQNLGENGTVVQLREQLRGVDDQLVGAIDNAITFWSTQTGPEAQAALLQFETLRMQILASQNEFVISAGQIQEIFANSMVDALDLFSQKLADGEGFIDSLAAAAESFASSFLKQLAQIGLQMLALKAARAIGFGSVDLFGGDKLKAAAPQLIVAGGTMTAAGGILTSAAAAWTATAGAIASAAAALLAANTVGSAGIFHGGGIAGSASRTRAVSPAWFAAAMRYHSGGVAGLRPNEVPTILERGEEILTRADPRHRFNGRGGTGGGGGGGSVNLKAVLVHDPAEALDAALGSSAGEKTVIGFLRRNAATVRAALDQ